MNIKVCSFNKIWATSYREREHRSGEPKDGSLPWSMLQCYWAHQVKPVNYEVLLAEITWLQTTLDYTISLEEIVALEREKETKVSQLTAGTVCYKVTCRVSAREYWNKWRVNHFHEWKVKSPLSEKKNWGKTEEAHQITLLSVKFRTEKETHWRKIRPNIYFSFSRNAWVLHGNVFTSIFKL